MKASGSFGGHTPWTRKTSTHHQKQNPTRGSYVLYRKGRGMQRRETEDEINEYKVGERKQTEGEGTGVRGYSFWGEANRVVSSLALINGEPKLGGKEGYIDDGP